MKRALSLLLSLVLLVGVLPTAGAIPLPPPDWALSAYQRLQEEPNYSSAPLFNSGPITRAEFLNLVMDTLQLLLSPDYLASIPPVEDDYFMDNPRGASSSYYPDGVYKAAACGIAEGRMGEDGLRYLDPLNPLTRQECAKILCSALDFAIDSGYPVTAAEAPAPYADQASIAAWAAPYTGRIAGYGLMVGDQSGNFAPLAQLDWPSAVVLAARTLDLLTESAPGLILQSALDWEVLSSLGGYSTRGLRRYTAQPWTGYDYDLRVAVDEAGTVTSVVALYDDQLAVERFDAAGNVTFSKSLPMELPLFGAFLAGSDGRYYLAFGEANLEENDEKEVWRIVQYDAGWNRLGAASVTGGSSLSTFPFDCTLARMALSDSGELTLHAARERYASGDGLNHQSNFTITVDTADMSVKSVSTPFPNNHVGHSFGQFVQYDGDIPVTVDHGDAYPRSFYLQKDGQGATLLALAGTTGENVTHAIGSGFEVSDRGYLFLGCSAPQKDFAAEGKAPWNVFLSYADKDLSSATLTWLTQSENTIDTARLVKLNENSFAALWLQDGCLHYQKLDGAGTPVGQEQIRPDLTAFPPTQPAVHNGTIYWIQYFAGHPRLFTLTPEA
ncbi:S-layer homology domain-containing protein [Pseudoflavonifractor phocaeensis]|uniref:S-layer homology domain-containing protein n=1 Tax=Pseudoflavonifractor phocaeensis TaxID=1870988 RepID=UPI00313B8975